MRAVLDATIRDLGADETLVREQTKAQLAKLKLQEDRLIELAINGTLPDNLIRERLAAIRADRAAAESQLESIMEDVQRGADAIREALKFLTNPARWYNHPLASDDAKKQLNAAIFSKIYVHVDADTRQVAIREVAYTPELAKLKAVEAAGPTITDEAIKRAIGDSDLSRITWTDPPQAAQKRPRVARTGPNTAPRPNRPAKAVTRLETAPGQELFSLAQSPSKPTMGCVATAYPKLRADDELAASVCDVAGSDKGNVVLAVSPCSRLSNAERGTLLLQVAEALVSWEMPTQSKLEACEASLAIGRQDQVRLSRSKQVAIVEAYRSGQGVLVVARRFGVHRSTVTRLLRQAGVPRRSSALTRDSVGAVRYYYATGHNIIQTAQYFGVSKSTLFAFMNDYDIPRRHHSERVSNVGVAR